MTENHTALILIRLICDIIYVSNFSYKRSHNKLSKYCHSIQRDEKHLRKHSCHLKGQGKYEKILPFPTPSHTQATCINQSTDCISKQTRSHNESYKMSPLCFDVFFAVKIYDFCKVRQFLNQQFMNQLIKETRQLVPVDNLKITQANLRSVATPWSNNANYS